MARPKVTTRRDQQLNFSLTADELTTLRMRAASAGMHLVDYGRAMLFRERWSNARGPTPDGAALRLNRLVFVQLRCIGNNLNQIARRLNSLNEAAPPSLEPLLQELRATLVKDVNSDR